MLSFLNEKKKTDSIKWTYIYRLEGNWKRLENLNLLCFLSIGFFLFPIPIQSCPETCSGNPPAQKKDTKENPRQKAKTPLPTLQKIKTWENVEKRWNNPRRFPQNCSHWTTTWIRRMPVIYSGSDAEVGSIMTPIRAVIRTSPLGSSTTQVTHFVQVKFGCRNIEIRC